MANFNTSYPITAKTEGGYNPGIGENETYKGIDRGANPNWSGWAIIDSLKPLNTAEMNVALSRNKDLQFYIIKFYLANYWNILNLSRIADQSIANNAYDCSVNQGSGIAGRFMQMASNKVGGNKLVVDGVIGDQSIAYINSLEAELVFNEINILREARYNATVANNPSQKQWLSSWLGRLLKYKTPQV